MADSPFPVRLLMYGALLLFAVVLFVHWRSAGPGGPGGLAFSPEGQPLPALGKPDPDWALRTLDGKEVRLGDFRGKVVFLNLWATWCPPCVGEIPGIEKLYDAMKDEGVAFVLASDERPEKVRDLVAARGWQVPVYTFASEPPAVLQTDGIPATFVLDRRGEVVFRHVGGARWDGEDCRAFLRRVRDAGSP